MWDWIEKKTQLLHVFFLWCWLSRAHSPLGLHGGCQQNILHYQKQGLRSSTAFSKAQHSGWTSLDHGPPLRWSAERRADWLSSGHVLHSGSWKPQNTQIWRLVKAKGRLGVPTPSGKWSGLDSGLVFVIFSSCVALQEGEIKVGKDSYTLDFLLCEIQIIIL